MSGAALSAGHLLCAALETRGGDSILQQVRVRRNASKLLE